MAKTKPFSLFMYVLVGTAGACRLRLTQKDRHTVAHDYHEVEEDGPIAHTSVDLKTPDAPKNIERFVRHIFAIKHLKFAVNFLLGHAFEMGREYERREARKRRQ